MITAHISDHLLIVQLLLLLETTLGLIITMAVENFQ